MTETQKTADDLKFEEALRALEDVLARLERSDCPLEDALELFGEGMKLVQLCRSKLSAAENKISILLKDSEEFIPFTGGESS
ncbi:MAG: exodeoxyribonuclease VII small subunit [Bacillota bacterium]|nr:exodeoxyribonuclease VII small subunit [Bacillota bacterium]MDW7683172.1 exodeoxyribonuclease VII small subunit [Bacillota bacterium]